MEAYQHDALTKILIACIIKVHNTLGRGFLESIYKRALIIELQKNQFSVKTEKEIGVYYEGIEVGRHRLDLVVEDLVIIELKTVSTLTAAHYAQLRSYLRATGKTVG